MIEVLLVDDHALFTRGVQSILKDETSIEVVGSVFDGIQAIDFLKKYPNTDIVLMDINMPNLDGIEATKIISKDYKHTKVIMLSMHDNETSIRKAFYAGAKGYLSKVSPTENLFSAIKNVHSGNTYICPTIAHSVVKSPLFDSDGQRSKESIEGLFSERESQVLQLICQGKTSKEISDELLASTRTIDVHRHNIMKKSKTTNTVELVIFAIKNGIIKIE